MTHPPRQHSSFRPVPRTGVIYVTTEARKHGYVADHPDWCNLGQGQPEAGQLPGAPPRVSHVTIDLDDNEYAPVAGLDEVREAVATLYNELYRQGKSSKYTAENVAVCGGGRLALTRVVASLGQINLGHFLPDYTAYEELLDIFSSFTSIPILLDPEEGYQFTVDALQREILGRGLGGILISNPCNPTGKLLHGAELNGWVKTARELDCTMLFDEFYSNYVWTDPENPQTVSAAEFVEDVNDDPVVILNGLTKNFRYPGWRVGWVVGPKSVISAVSSAGSFLDGGGSRPLQRAALPLLAPELVRRETEAIFNRFGSKRKLLLDGLARFGITRDCDPLGTFYAWGNLSKLDSELADGMRFFTRGLDEKLIVVPGEFFDVNPGKRRPGRASRFRQHARFSYGAPVEVLEEGIHRIGRMVGAGG